MSRVPIPKASSCLVVFDMQNEFVRPPQDPARTESIAASGAIERCREILTFARQEHIPVFYVNSSHRPDAADFAPTVVDAATNLVPFPDGPRLMGPPRGADGTPGVEVIDELAPEPEDFVVKKHRWGAFTGTSLDILLRGLHIDTILLTGGSTDLGVLSTAFAARDLGYNVVVLRDACHTQRPEAQVYCMEWLFPRMARVMTVGEAVDLLE
jgi:ureidoacrylate peracid hydrolase